MKLVNYSKEFLEMFLVLNFFENIFQVIMGYDEFEIKKLKLNNNPFYKKLL